MFRKASLCILAICMFSLLTSCAKREEKQLKDVAADGRVKLIVLNPGHYHAALVQKTMYDEVDRKVHVYAPSGSEVQEYLKRIDNFNTRIDNPTNWLEKVYTGDDYLEKMLADRSGNVVVMSGNNQKKTLYIKSAVDAGLNVFCDKPMCIGPAGFRLLEQAFASADKKGVLLYDIMTERYNVFHILQKMLVLDRDVFGELQKGSPTEPAVVKESMHHFFKYVSGTPIKRPTWYFDTAQQGEGLVDVTTHLIDLVMWTCFPEQAVDYRRDVVMKKARRWPTMITRQQYEKVTGATDFPGFLKVKLNDDGVLPYYANGEMVYALRGIHVRLSVSWDFQAPEGAGDTQYSLFTGSKARVILKQDKEQDYQPQLYVEPGVGITLEQLHTPLRKAIDGMQNNYPGLSLKRQSNCWQVLITNEHQSGHEAHFRKVTERYLQYLAEGKLPAWEVSNMIAKYYITTTALQLAQK